MTNAERQADFRKRHPGYNHKYKARYRAAALAGRAAMYAANRAADAALTQPHALPQVLALPAPRVPLMLPAPVEMIEIPGMTTIETVAIRELQPISRPASDAP